MQFNLTYDNLSKNGEQIYKDLIETVLQICTKVPNGVLLVFPSFRLQKDFQYNLSRSPKKYNLEKHKYVMFEEKNNANDI
jgi:Rad3-related DNA helicase